MCEYVSQLAEGKLVGSKNIFFISILATPIVGYFLQKWSKPSGVLENAEIRKSPIVNILLVLNFTFFYFEILFTKLNISDILLDSILSYKDFNPLTTITYQFIHGDGTHIINNMIVLFLIGPDLEKEIGGLKFILFYLSCGIIGGLIQIFFHHSDVIGASASIYGIMGMLILSKNRLLSLISLFLILTEIKIFIYDKGVDGIGHLAHISGAISGLIFIFIEKYLIKK